MNATRSCDDKESLIGYLYDECDPDERARLSLHLAACPDCRAELETLQGVRGRLAEWVPPDRSLGFKIVRDDRPARRMWAWGLAAAAVLLLAAAGAVGNLRIQYGPQQITITTGWRPPAPAATAGADAGAPWRTDLRALESRLRAQLVAPPQAPASTTTAARGPVTTDADMMRRVRSLIDESERRQQRELALRLTELLRDIDTQRRADLVRIQQGFGQLEGRTGAEAARQRELLNYLVRVSQRR